MDRDVVSWLRQQLESANPDMLRTLLQTMVQGLMSAESSAICNAGYGERSDDRENSRNGYPPRD
jgi:transposase-like protein